MQQRTLSDLAGIGPAMLKDFDLLGIRSVKQLSQAHPQQLYDRLCQITQTQHDICVLDVFSCTIAQARNPNAVNRIFMEPSMQHNPRIGDHFYCNDHQ
jgi:nucleotidyltransferase/DNA polymerase involved in DNA repair